MLLEGNGKGTIFTGWGKLRGKRAKLWEEAGATQNTDILGLAGRVVGTIFFNWLKN